MKSPDAFRTISEAASELGVPQHVLRFWETKFSFIRPMKRAGGRRFYRRQDIDVLRGVRTLLHEEGYTIKGVQKLHKDLGMRRVLAAGGAGEAEYAPDNPIESEVDRPLLGQAARQRLGGVLGDLEGVKARLDALLKG
jgi:DNA-binding transcriptional MerR regulator